MKDKNNHDVEPKEEPLLEIRNLNKKFGSLEVIKKISLSVYKSDVIVFIGPSGCGKSTLLRCMNHLELPTSGEVLYRKKHLPKDEKSLVLFRTRIGMVFQRFHLFPHLNIMDNLILAPSIVKKEEIPALKDRANFLLNKVGLISKSLEYPSNLSGGQQQRIAIARCLMMEPDLLLFDEPTSALDPELVGEVLALIRNLAKEGSTMCIVTHEMNFAKDIATKVCMMDSGEIIEEGNPLDILSKPTHNRTQVFLQRVLEKTIS